MARKKTLPHRRARKKVRTRPVGTVEPGPGRTVPAEPAADLTTARRTPPVSPAPKGPAVAVDFKDLELYVRRELVRIAIVAAVVFGLILIVGSLTH